MIRPSVMVQRRLATSTMKIGSRGLATHIATPTQAPVLLEDVEPSQRDKLPVFTISRERGFLPRVDPLTHLPAEFAPLESLLQRMTIRQPNGGVGLLGHGQFADACETELKKVDLESKVDQVIESGNQQLLSALFRDYCYATSAFLLEPVDQRFRHTGVYGEGNNRLPRELAVPMKKLADKLGHFPFMEYSSSYALQNYVKIQSKVKPGKLGPLSEWATDNLNILRAFEDASGSEAGFILVHVTMVAHTGRVVAAAEDVLKASQTGDHKAFQSAMGDLLATYEKIQVAMESMWSWSRPVDYLRFRSFIFGTGPKKSNSMFPNGVVYEGIGTDEPQYFRGESGANDLTFLFSLIFQSIIPLADNLLEITRAHPKNELTSTLREFREYRPSAQRVYLEALERRASETGVFKFAQQSPESLALYILMVDQVREFRDRHWKFTKSYIIRYSDHAIATGGSPILRYLPQNLTTVLNCMADAFTLLPNSHGLAPTTAAKIEACRGRAERELEALKVELGELRGGVKGVDDKRVHTRGSVGCDGIS
ncbi:BQ5605_C001g00439 [Microbotryum silenes-dioicae]|uniref:BQ5605_C001g00439 protein n=1 Tax=Microbotryum silenes-dioicae TaxID=796604 RepID=A0A2X0M6S0_9BASI|nr:BQ5605_C001g00439 [Microbotryum silenes-dioicae]